MTTQRTQRISSAGLLMLLALAAAFWRGSTAHSADPAPIDETKTHLLVLGGDSFYSDHLVELFLSALSRLGLARFFTF